MCALTGGVPPDHFMLNWTLASGAVGHVKVRSATTDATPASSTSNVLASIVPKRQTRGGRKREEKKTRTTGARAVYIQGPSGVASQGELIIPAVHSFRIQLLARIAFLTPGTATARKDGTKTIPSLGSWMSGTRLARRGGRGLILS